MGMLQKSMLLLQPIVLISIKCQNRFIGKGKVESSILSCSTIYPLKSMTYKSHFAKSSIL